MDGPVFLLQVCFFIKDHVRLGCKAEIHMDNNGRLSFTSA